MQSHEEHIGTDLARLGYDRPDLAQDKAHVADQDGGVHDHSCCEHPVDPVISIRLYYEADYVQYS